MTGFELSPAATLDLLEILENAAEFKGSYAADGLQDKLLDGCARLAKTPGLGHRRQDLTSKPQFFYFVEPYMITYVRDAAPLVILRILHSSRNLRKLLRSRPNL